MKINTLFLFTRFEEEFNKKIRDGFKTIVIKVLLEKQE